MKEMRAALDLDPLSVVIYWDIGSELLMAKRYDDALSLLEKANDLFPNFPIILFEQAEAYYKKGDHAASERVMETFKSAHPEMANDPTMLALLANAEARAGRRAEARRMLDQVEQAHVTRYVEPVLALTVSETLGDQVAVDRWLDRTRQERSAMFL